MQHTQYDNQIVEYTKIIKSDFFIIGPVVAFIWKNDPIWSVEALSANIKNYFKYDNTQFLEGNITYLELIHPDDLDRVKEEVKNASLLKQTSFTHQMYRIRDAGGVYRWVKDSTAIIYDYAGEITHFVGYIICVNNEIETNRELTKLLEEQKNELQTIFDTTKDGIAVIDFETNFKKVNKAYCDITGFSNDELLQTSCIELTHHDDIEMARIKVIELFKFGHIDGYEKRCNGKEKIITVSLAATLLPDEKLILLTMKDISSVKIFEEQAKLASMGEMIGNIAHQWRQPLSVITTMASGIQVKQEYGLLKQNTLEDDMETIISQANYLSKTIDDFRNFIRNTDERFAFSLNSTIEKTLGIVLSAMKNHGIEIISNLNSDMMIWGYENELIQSFINIINNSRDSIVAHVDVQDERFIVVESFVFEDKFVLKIIDNGGGIPEGIIHKIFEPYFTTKHKSVGTGIGLSMVHKLIIDRHNGEIKVYNTNYKYKGVDYKGACFEIIFLKNGGKK